MSSPRSDLLTGLSALKWEYLARAANCRLQITSATSRQQRRGGLHLPATPPSPQTRGLSFPNAAIVGKKVDFRGGQHIMRPQWLLLILQVQLLQGIRTVYTDIVPVYTCTDISTHHLQIIRPSGCEVQNEKYNSNYVTYHSHTFSIENTSLN